MNFRKVEIMTSVKSFMPSRNVLFKRIAIKFFFAILSFLCTNLAIVSSVKMHKINVTRMIGLGLERSDGPLIKFQVELSEKCDKYSHGKSLIGLYGEKSFSTLKSLLGKEFYLLNIHLFSIFIVFFLLSVEWESRIKLRRIFLIKPIFKRRFQSFY